MIRKFELSYEELLDKLFQIQSEMNGFLKENNHTLYRMLELDMYNLLEKLNFNVCEFCQYKQINRNEKCDLEPRCQSYILLKKINKTNEGINTKLEFVFKTL